MEETKEAKAARKEISVMEEARAKCKKYFNRSDGGKVNSSRTRSRSDIIVWEMI